MIAKTACYVALVFALFLLTGYAKCQVAEKYQPGDRNVEVGQTMQWSFDTEQVGGPPTGAKIFSGNWMVRVEAGAPSAPNALCQTGTATFPALSLGDKIFADVIVSTNFKPISGSEDRAAGIIFRIQDKDNFYILRANALEDNVNIYKYVGGSRHEVQGGSAKVASGTWQELRVEVKGNVIHGFLNGKQVVEARDDTYKAGKVGLWTKADSVTCFDNITAIAQ